MTAPLLNPAKQYAESDSAPRLAKEIILALIAEIERLQQLSESQEEALAMMERGAL